MNNKFNIGERVKLVECYHYQDDLTREEYENKPMTIKKVIVLENEIGYKVNENNWMWIESDLTPYIEEDTQEGETKFIFIGDEVLHKADGVLTIKEKIIYGDNCYQYKVEENDNVYDEETLHPYYMKLQEKCCEKTVGLDYEKEYNLLLEEHEQTKELLEIAKVALKLTTELISTND
jgi:hypothetical protein